MRRAFSTFKCWCNFWTWVANSKYGFRKIYNCPQFAGVLWKWRYKWQQCLVKVIHFLLPLILMMKEVREALVNHLKKHGFFLLLLFWSIFQKNYIGWKRVVTSQTTISSQKSLSSLPGAERKLEIQAIHFKNLKRKSICHEFVEWNFISSYVAAKFTLQKKKIP